jgi:hypothetical protein
MIRSSIYFFLFIIACLNITAQTATCKKSETTDGGDSYPLISKTCRYNTIQTIVTGTAGSTGVYVYYYMVTLNGKEVENSAIFNSQQDKLLARINESFKAKFEALKKDPAYSDCFSLRKDLPPQKMNALGIEFDEDKIKFTCALSLPPMCSGANQITIALKIKDVEKYFKD